MNSKGILTYKQAELTLTTARLTAPLRELNSAEDKMECIMQLSEQASEN